MAESLFASLLHSLDKHNISQIANFLDESEQGIFRGLESSMACVLGVMASKAEDPGALRQMIDLVPEDSGEISWPKLASGLSSPETTWIGKGKEILGDLFGSNSTVIANAVARESGVSSGTAITLLSMSAPMVLRFLSRRVADEGLSMRTLGTRLRTEAATIRSALPSRLTDLLWPSVAAASASYPVIAQSVQHEKRSAAWLGALCLAAVALGCLGLWSHFRRPGVNMDSAGIGEANRMADEGVGMGPLVKRTLPNRVNINVPVNGVESQLLGVIEGTNPAGRTTWLDFDRLTFDSGSSVLRVNSSEQLDNVAAILKAYPNVKLLLTGYTDSVGNPATNMALSRARAEAVKNELVFRGIAPDRLTTKGYGEQSSTADNSTAGGRARNRRVSLQVTQK